MVFHRISQQNKWIKSTQIHQNCKNSKSPSLSGWPLVCRLVFVQWGVVSLRKLDQSCLLPISEHPWCSPLQDQHSDWHFSAVPEKLFSVDFLGDVWKTAERPFKVHTIIILRIATIWEHLTTQDLVINYSPDLRDVSKSTTLNIQCICWSTITNLSGFPPKKLLTPPHLFISPHLHHSAVVLHWAHHCRGQFHCFPIARTWGHSIG